MGKQSNTIVVTFSAMTLIWTCSQCIAADQNSAAKLLEKGKAFQRSYDFTAAIDVFTQAIRLDPTCAEAFRERGAAYNQNDDYDRAIADFTEAIRLSPNDNEACVGRGVSFESKGQADKAKADFARAIAICDERIRRDPKNAEAYISRGLANGYSGKESEAIADFTEAIRLVPTNAIAYHSRGNMYDLSSSTARAQGDRDQAMKARAQAVKDWTEAIRLDPKYVQPYEAMGSLYAEQGEHDKAIAQFTQAIRLIPLDGGAYWSRGNSRRAKGELDAAIADYSEAIRLCPKWAYGYRDRGVAYEMKGDKTKASEDFAQAKKLGYQDPPPAAESNPGLGESLLEEDADLPELQTWLQSGPNDIRDILVVDDGFLAATGAAIIRYRYSGDVPAASATYTDRDGLPSGNCYLLKQDAEGGVWAHCQGGVGYLAAKSNRWKSFMTKDGLAPGKVTNLAISPDGTRIWVTSTGGLSTARVKDQAWRAFPQKNLLDILVHPTHDIVWCRRLIASRCMCGRHVVSLQFDLETRGWREIPESGNCAHVAPAPVYFSVADDRLWLSAGSDPPMLYDPNTGTTKTWPKEPNWERLKDGHEVTYSDWLGEMVFTAGNGGGAWFASNAGLWHYDAKKNDWQSHLHNPRPGCGQALLAQGRDRTTLYWVCEGRISAFDIRTGQWTDLWHVDCNSSDEHTQQFTLSPDGSTLWLLGIGGVFAGNASTRKAVVLTNQEQPGLGLAKLVRFDPRRHLALIGTPQGVVGSDYAGRLMFLLSRPAPPLLHKATGIEIAPDGSEVWCLMTDRHGYPAPAAVLHPDKNRWEVAPSEAGSRFHDAAFSADGKTVWLAQTPGGDDDSQSVMQHRLGTGTWEPLGAAMPRSFGSVDRLWPAPRGNELWMGAQGSGLLRAELASGRVTYYGGPESRPMRPPLLEGHTILGDDIKDVTFASQGKIAVCSATAGGGANDGLSVIDLATGKAANYPKKNFYNAQLVVAPDGHTVWCNVNRSLLYAFDIEKRSWTHELSKETGMPLGHFGEFQCSADGRFVWLRGYGGAAVYELATKTWKKLMGQEWESRGSESAPLFLTADEKHVLTAHQRGLALIKVDGSDYEILPFGANLKNASVGKSVSLPKGRGYACAVSHPEAGGLYHVDLGRRSLRRIKDLKESTVTAMSVGPDGFLWIAVPGKVLCVDPLSGEDRTGIKALEIGEPAAQLLHAVGSDSRVTVAPKPATKARIAPRPQQAPARPAATNLQTKGMVWRSTHVPLIATSDTGKTYVTWFAHAKEDTPARAGLPQIPADLLPKDGSAGRATGISIHDGRKWLPPQLLTTGMQDCEVLFAWCQQEDLHLLIKTSGEKRLYHLAYSPSTRQWSKLCVLDHGGWKFCLRNGTVHLADFDSGGHRVCYRAFDGKAWSKASWFQAKRDFDGPAVAADNDGTGHVVWREEDGTVGHAVVKDGKAESSRQRFADRPIHPNSMGEFAIVAAPDGTLMMAYRAELYEGHPDEYFAHLRTWNGRSWSDAVVVPFDTGDFSDPIFLRHGSTLSLSWVGDSDRGRVYSVLGSDGVWSYPVPVCSARGGKGQCDHFAQLHIDQQGGLHAAWCEGQETFAVMAGKLKQ